MQLSERRYKITISEIQTAAAINQSFALEHLSLGYCCDKVDFYCCLGWEDFTSLR